MNKWYNLTIEKIYEEVKSGEKGLNKKEAMSRLIALGKNELPKNKKDSAIKIFFMQFLEPIILLLLVAAAISLLVNEKIDAMAILLIVIVDALMGTFQERKAEKNSESLKNLIKVKVKVIREEDTIEINSEDLVIGDIVLVEPGTKVSADLRIISANNLTVDESVLTGESMSVNKKEGVFEKEVSLAERTNMLYAGTSILAGRAYAIVVSTAVNTEIGMIASTVTQTKDEHSPLTIRMAKYSKQISAIVVFVSILVAVILFLKGYKGIDVFLAVVALSVSAMPEGLPLALTMALTIASNRMYKKNVIVKKLNSVESLGSCTVIASDKTGTLTVNEQTAKKIILPNGDEYSVDGTGYNNIGKVIPSNGAKLKYAEYLAKLGVVNNEGYLKKENKGWESFGDSIDIAFLSLGYKLKQNDLRYSVVSEIPYESANKYSAVFFEEKGKTYSTVKGSLEEVLSFCDKMADKDTTIKLDKRRIINQNNLLASQGYRVIALASGEIEKKEEYTKKDLKTLTFQGLIGFIDPIRKEALKSIKECRDAGIKVVMITGDHSLTALSISKELGLAKNESEVATGEEIAKYLEKGEDEFDKYVAEKTVFARVTPIQKLEIVNSYKRQGEYVAVTGDGVNDAPAIKVANIGVAMGSGTDVAKETANMIVVDDNFKSIVLGVKEGRNAYKNIRKITNMLLSCGVAEVLFFLLSIIFNLPIPLLAIQLLWLNLVTDGLQDLALSFERETDVAMKEKPRNPKESVFEKHLVQSILVGGITMGIIVFFVWLFLIKVVGMNVGVARGYVMALMVFLQNMHVLNCRSETKSVFNNSIKKNYFVLFTIFGALVLQVLVMEVEAFSALLQTHSIPFMHLIILFIISIPIIFVCEIYKYIKNTSDKEKN